MHSGVSIYKRNDITGIAKLSSYVPGKMINSQVNWNNRLGEYKWMPDTKQANMQYYNQLLQICNNWMQAYKNRHTKSCMPLRRVTPYGKLGRYFWSKKICMHSIFHLFPIRIDIFMDIMDICRHFRVKWVTWWSGPSTKFSIPIRVHIQIPTPHESVCHNKLLFALFLMVTSTTYTLTLWPQG